MDSVKRTRIRAAVAGAFFWVILGVLACYGANQLGRGSIAEPGAGFIFFWSGLVLMTLSLIVLADSLRSSEDTIRRIPKINWPKIILVLFSLLLYAFFLERLGFVLTTFVLMSFLLGCIEGRGWFRSLGIASAAALTSYAMFELWLKIRLPKGFFGF
jgi:putative tricarboxylic transport membrane protein